MFAKTISRPKYTRSVSESQCSYSNAGSRTMNKNFSIVKKDCIVPLLSMVNENNFLRVFVLLVKGVPSNSLFMTNGKHDSHAG